ncbi:MAG TPA: cupin domain-containing protein [Candidatus Eisenbacteria bacterium]|jgi:mannose-6-phosphate isomerase-like protein (cupin superfamily)
MEAFELADIELRRRARGTSYHEFLRRPSMSVGLYVLPAGGTDPQRPHTEDEAYLVLRGRARIRVGSEDRAVEPGTVVFVPARVEHRFHDITEELSLAVWFAPAEGTTPQG